MGGRLDRRPPPTPPAGTSSAGTDRRDLVALVRGEVERDLGAFLPPIEAHSPAPRSLAAAWTMLRAILIEPGLVDRTTKEAAATAVSLANSCWYCAELHLTVLEARNERRAAELADSELATLADRHVRLVTDWARTAGLHADAGPRRPFGDQHVPELVGTIVVCHYLNRMANVFVPADARQLLDRVAEHAHRTPEPSASLDLLPAAPLPADLSWASGRPDVAEALARAAAVIDEAGARSVPESVRAVLSARLAGWHGEMPDTGTAWLADLVSEVPPEDRSAARIALLTALSPGEVAVPPQWTADGSALVELTSWAAFAAARRVGAWLAADTVASDTPSRVLPFRRRATIRAHRPRPAGTADDGRITLSP